MKRKVSTGERCSTGVLERGLSAMNPFRIAADLSHLASILILLRTIQKTNSIDGVSLKTQILYVLVFVSRYLDLLALRWISLYNTVMKIFFIGSSVYTVMLLQRAKVSNAVAYKEMMLRDSFKIRYLVGASAALALFFNERFTFIDVWWSFSLWLESIAILPQLFMLSKSGKAQSLTIHYIFALGLYRALYIPNWFWRWFVEDKSFPKLAFVTGVIQTLLYSDFFYIYYKKVFRGGGISLPH